MSAGIDGMVCKPDWDGKIPRMVRAVGHDADSNEIDEAHQLVVPRISGPCTSPTAPLASSMLPVHTFTTSIALTS
jgi:hypothetical protein